MADNPHKRKNYLINTGFQLNYTLSIVLTLLVVVFISGTGLYLGMWGAIIENFSRFKVSQELENVRRITDYEEARFSKGDFRLEKIFREAELLSERERETLKDALKSVNRSLVPKVLALALFIFIGGIFLSHKIAGPMYRFERSAKAVKEGDLSVDFKVRKSDQMRQTASNLEEMIESLRSDIEKMKRARDEGNLEEIGRILSKYKT